MIGGIVCVCWHLNEAVIGVVRISSCNIQVMHVLT